MKTIINDEFLLNTKTAKELYEIAKDMLCAIYMDDGNEKRSDCLGKKFEYQSLEGSAREAIRYANVLIEELKKYDNG